MRNIQALSALVLGMAAACGTAPQVDQNHYETSSVTTVTVTSTVISGSGGNYSAASSGADGSNVGGFGGSSGGMGGDNSSANGNGGFGGASSTNSAGGNYNVGGAGGVGGSDQGGFGGNDAGGSLNQVSSSTVGSTSSSVTSSSTGSGSFSSSGAGGSGGDCGDLLGKFTTYTQGGWDNHTKTLPAALFANGVLVGDKNSDYALFTSVNAVTDFLPAMEMPNALKGQYVDPLTTPAGVLAGQTLTLKLNMLTSDQACGYTLGDLLVTEGTCKGKTVSQVLDLADLALAGANVNMSYSDVNKCVEKVNLNFDNGKVDKKYLVWP